MGKNLVARASITVNASIHRVWNALVDPEAIQRYMFGTKVESDWREGSPIVWKGEWKGKPYEDKGTIVRMRPGLMIRYTHYSPLSGLPDTPSSYHTVTIALASESDYTHVSLEQDNNATEEALKESERNWETMLTALKRYIEK